MKNKKTIITCIIVIIGFFTSGIFFLSKKKERDHELRTRYIRMRL